MIRGFLALFRRPAALTASQAHQALADGAVLLDVRERDEWRAGYAPQARHVVLGQLEDHLGDLPSDRPIVTVCRSGRRSAMAANLLTRHGYTASVRASQAQQRLAGTGMDNLHVLTAGVPGYATAGGRVVQGRPRWALERQVRLGRH